jgi:hypothetical protein
LLIATKLPSGPRPEVVIYSAISPKPEAQRPVFFGVRWHGTCKQHFRSKISEPRSWWPCSAAPASGSRGAKVGERWHDFRPPLPSFSWWVLSSSHWDHMCRYAVKMNSLALLGPVVLPLLEFTMQRTSLAALCNDIVCAKRRLRGSPVTKRTNIRCARPFAISSPLRLPVWCC